MPVDQEKLVVGVVVAAIIILIGYQLLRLAKPSGALPIVAVLVVITALLVAATLVD